MDGNHYYENISNNNNKKKPPCYYGGGNGVPQALDTTVIFQLYPVKDAGKVENMITFIILDTLDTICSYLSS